MRFVNLSVVLSLQSLCINRTAILSGHPCVLDDEILLRFEVQETQLHHLAGFVVHTPEYFDQVFTDSLLPSTLR